jgi:CheY-like chemotaxis protein
MSRVLVIEDNSADVDLLKRAFASHGIKQEIVALDDGEQAIRFLDDLHSTPDVDLVIIDLNIPKHDGIEVLNRYRTHPLMVDVPVVVFTSSGSPAERNRAMTLGVTAYLRKPMELDEYLALGATFRDMLAKAR